MLMLNGLDRYQIAIDAIRHVPEFAQRYAGVAQHFADEQARLRAYAYEHGTDSALVTGWDWVTALGTPPV
jgi:xylulose-5-phosphate/fructose-6-phosphate phosphoketolase